MPFKPTSIALPAPKPVRFERTPLALVVCQIRFEHLGAPSEDDLRVLRDALADEYPVVQPLQAVQVQVGPPGAQAEANQGWRFVSIDGHWSLSLLPDFAAVETSAYKDWEDFDRRLRMIFDALAKTLKPRVEVRLGLRYVNELQLDAVTAPSDWSRYLRPELVALTASDVLAPAAANAQQTIQVDGGDGAVLNFRHGFPGSLIDEVERPVYLLDFDCFREGQRPLDVNAALAEADRFNTMITSLFQWCITEELWKELGPVDK
jgi:uncharacterized protein (TIGR04255 family)